jgi:hypothetical protein
MASNVTSVQSKVRDSPAVEVVSSVTPEDLAAVLEVLVGPAVEVDAGVISEVPSRRKLYAG